MPRWVNMVLLLAVLAVLGYALTLLPGGYDTDLSQLGQGRPAAVLVHDHGLVRSQELVQALDDVRGHFEPQTLFLIADPEHPDGAGFAERHGLGRATLALFDGEGELLARYEEAPEPRAVADFLNRHEMPRADGSGW